MALHLAFWMVLATACGYSLVRSGDRAGGVQTIAVETLRNDSAVPGAELLVTAALRKEFLRRGGFQLVSEPSKADLVVSGRLLPLEISARSFSSVVLALEYSVRMTIDLKVRRQDGTEVPIDGRSLTETELYLASSDVEVGRKNQEEALRRISAVLAGRFLDALYLAREEQSG